MSMMRDTILVAAAACSCTAAPVVPAVHFPDAPPVTLVDDRRDVSAPPEVTPNFNRLLFYDRAVVGPILRALALPRSSRALGVNALDEVPDSTWFTNRIGVADLSPDEIRTGPLTDEGPELHKPWTIRSTKPGGAELGFVIADARGIKYLMKFDDADLPEIETGAHVVVNRLLWACGYNVPEDEIAYVRPSELLLAPDATIKDGLGRSIQRLDRWGVDQRLAKVWHTSDGRLRVMVSRWLPGTSLGGAPVSGVRGDDPNDRIPHERRRDLRGQYPIFAWVDHVDLNGGSFLDMWIPDPHHPQRHYVEHYRIDFGKSLGVMASTGHYPQEGHVYSVDYPDMARSLVTFGIARRPWGQHLAPALTGVATTFVAEDFDPGAWHPDIPYRPFEEADRFDKFWGARLVARFGRDQIHAAVEAGQFSDPRAVEYLTDTLVARQRATEAYWFSRVNPLVDFAADEDSVCFDDLAIDVGLVPAAATRYEVTSYDARMRPLGGVAAVGAAASGPTCTPPLAKSTAGDGYTIVKIETRRSGFSGHTFVHLARDPSSGAWHVIGVWRP